MADSTLRQRACAESLGVAAAAELDLAPSAVHRLPNVGEDPDLLALARTLKRGDAASGDIHRPLAVLAVACVPGPLP